MCLIMGCRLRPAVLHDLWCEHCITTLKSERLWAPKPNWPQRLPTRNYSLHEVNTQDAEGCLCDEPICRILKRHIHWFMPGNSKMSIFFIKNWHWLCLRIGTEGNAEHPSSQKLAHLLGPGAAGGSFGASTCRPAMRWLDYKRLVSLCVSTKDLRL